MTNYKKITVFLNEDLFNDINKIIEHRNRRVILDEEDLKPASIEEFVTGSVIQVLKWLNSQEVSSGLSDLGKPYRLKNHFKEILKRKGMIQRQLAEKSGIDPSNISIILANKSQPSLDYFLRIWIALDCPPLNECLSREEDEK